MSDTAQAETTPESFDSAESAMRHIFAAIDKKKSPAESADAATAEPESASPEDDAAPAEPQATGETQEQDPAEEPSLPLPRSWTKEQSEHWTALPRATQEYLIAQDSKASEAVRRAQNDAAEKLKGLTAKEQAAEEARQKYEAKLPDVMQGLIDQNNQQFSDIKSMTDVETLAREAMRLSTTDPVAAGQIHAYLQAWQVHQQKLASTKAELDQSTQRRSEQTRKETSERKTRENSLLIEKAPEFADGKKLKAAQDEAFQLFRDKGFSDDELSRLDNPLLDDHRMQLIINDALKFRAMEVAKAAIPGKVAKNLPPVQRPGVARSSGDQTERIQALETRLTNSGSLDDAFALRMARQNAGRWAS